MTLEEGDQSPSPSGQGSTLTVSQAQQSQTRPMTRQTYPAPPTADMNPNRAKSFHGTSGIHRDGPNEQANRRGWDLHAEQEGGPAAAYPWNEEAEEERANGHHFDLRNQSFSNMPDLKAKGRAYERSFTLGRKDIPRFPRTASTLTVGTGLEGHPTSSIGGLGWDALEAGDLDGKRWNDRMLRDGETPLDRTIDEIGMGRYQKTLLILSGLGYLADNMWLQGIAIVLPRVQDEFHVEDRWIGLLSSSTFAGMMVGALAWGSCKLRGNPNLLQSGLSDTPCCLRL